MIPQAATLLAYAALLATASPVIQRRTVTELNEEATKEAHQRDDTATRAFSDIQIKTADGRCLFVDKLSGDFRANLTPIRVADCGAKDGQGWDVITAGKHNDQSNTMLIVSTLGTFLTENDQTQACFNFDPRRAAGNQVNLFSCGGRAAGEGQVTDSQLFALDTGAGPSTFQPKNVQGKCFVVKGSAVDVADCNAGDKAQSFAFGGPAAGGNAGGGNGAQQPVPSTTAAAVATGSPTADCEDDETVTMTMTATVNPGRGGPGNLPVATLAPEVTSAPAAAPPAASTVPAGGNGNGTGNGDGGQKGNIPAANPTSPVAVSRAGGTLNPTAAAEAHVFDSTATRAFTKAAIRAPNGQCLSVDPTAGDFRQNLIPVALAACDGTPNQQFDVVSKGKHNDGKDNSVLVVSSLTNGCVSTDGRRADGDTVTIFSCGGRAAGEGLTNTGQLVRVFGDSFLWSPVNDEATCVVPGGQGRLVTAACKGDNSETYTIVA
ncbi:ricin-type beta-trefoil lectin domain-containing protein [Colletotrichum tofieldiae]|uniref:Ricin-type beta-trefoil lectin domain-containing protein n=1 Tax=Colletotrichum tofieldiae TaxID=708197 RepID=A0A166R4L6_9PEZI|nr:Ricin-type beta-trefoil lectin domain-containing protein [Colletotrichum tofieldiae]GKT54136.1 ricin-type beta-trefoil lectin domain-containing protein [Colletotrichum tofieldiae]GKT73867.1 ricin-type beta-trefoil lectin domain-containing protein [Colletotrichum tofieldiae]